VKRYKLGCKNTCVLSFCGVIVFVIGILEDTLVMVSMLFISLFDCFVLPLRAYQPPEGLLMVSDWLRSW